MLRALWRPSKFFGPNINRLYLVRALAGSCALLTRVCSLRTQTYFRTRRLLGLQWWSWLMFCRCRCRDYDLPWFLMERWCLTKRSQVRLELVWVPRVEFSREGQRGKIVKTVKKKKKCETKRRYRPHGETFQRISIWNSLLLNFSIWYETNRLLWNLIFNLVLKLSLLCFPEETAWEPVASLLAIVTNCPLDVVRVSRGVKWILNLMIL